MAGSDRKAKSARGPGRPRLSDDEETVRRSVALRRSLLDRVEEEAEARGVKAADVLRAAIENGLRQMARARRRSRS